MVGPADAAAPALNGLARAVPIGDVPPVALGTWLALVALFLAGGLTPGPAVMLIVTCSLRYGFGHAMLAALGICGANLVWIALALSGAAALAQTSPGAFAALKLAGLAFIVVLATRMVRAGAVDLTRRAPPPKSRLFGSGAALQLANPNALVYFGGMLPAYLDPARPVPFQAAVVATSVTVTELIGLAVYGAAAEALARSFAARGFASGFMRVSALAMVGAACFGVYATWR